MQNRHKNDPADFPDYRGNQKAVVSGAPEVCPRASPINGLPVDGHRFCGHPPHGGGPLAPLIRSVAARIRGRGPIRRFRYHGTPLISPKYRLSSHEPIDCGAQHRHEVTGVREADEAIGRPPTSCRQGGYRP